MLATCLARMFLEYSMSSTMALMPLRSASRSSFTVPYHCTLRLAAQALNCGTCKSPDLPVGQAHWSLATFIGPLVTEKKLLAVLRIQVQGIKSWTNLSTLS